MFRDILVILGVKGVVASYALSFARHFDAEVTAVWPAQYPFETIGDAQTRYDLAAAAEEQAEEESAARTLEFVEQAHHFGVKAHRSQMISNAESPATYPIWREASISLSSSSRRRSNTPSRAVRSDL
ncbi:MAG: hypothetical protein WAL59_27540 [Roseiarcus sp.]